MLGVDVSIFNAEIEWRELKAAGIDFAICRTGYGKTGLDESFQRNVHGAHAAGLICGAYHYSYALNVSDAIKEARFCKQIISDSGVLLELPIFFDMEDADNYKKNRGFVFNKYHVTNICRAFLSEIKPLEAGVYASYFWLTEYIDWRTFHCPIWNAQWSKNDNLRGFMWQFTDSLRIGGKLFDGNVLYD